MQFLTALVMQICFQAVHACVCLQSLTRSSLTWYIVNHLRKFHQIYNFGAAVHTDELIRFWNQKFRVQGHSETAYSPISTLGGIFSPISGVHGRIFIKSITVTHYQNYVTLITFSRSWVQRSRSPTCSEKKIKIYPFPTVAYQSMLCYHRLFSLRLWHSSWLWDSICYLVHSKNLVLH